LAFAKLATVQLWLRSQREKETVTSEHQSITCSRKDFAPLVKGKCKPIFPGEFVLPSLRHTILTGLGKSGVDAFTIMRIAGHSSIVVSQRYIHPTPEAVERAFERLQLSGDVLKSL
jgi:integrase